MGSGIASWACYKPETSCTSCKDNEHLTILDPLARAGTCTAKKCEYCKPRRCCYLRKTSDKIFYHAVAGEQGADGQGVCVNATECEPKLRPNTTCQQGSYLSSRAFLIAVAITAPSLSKSVCSVNAVSVVSITNFAMVSGISCGSRIFTPHFSVHTSGTSSFSLSFFDMTNVSPC